MGEPRVIICAFQVVYLSYETSPQIYLFENLAIEVLYLSIKIYLFDTVMPFSNQYVRFNPNQVVNSSLHTENFFVH